MIQPSYPYFIFTLSISFINAAVAVAMILLVLWQGGYKRVNRYMAVFLFSIFLGGTFGFFRQLAPFLRADITEFLVGLVLTGYFLGAPALFAFLNGYLDEPMGRFARLWQFMSLLCALLTPIVFVPSGLLFTNARLTGISSFTFAPSPLMGIIMFNLLVQMLYIVNVSIRHHDVLPRTISWGIYTFALVSIISLLYPPFSESGLTNIFAFIYAFLFANAIFVEEHLNPLISLNAQLRESDLRYRTIVDMVFDLDYVIEHSSEPPNDGGYVFRWTKNSNLANDYFPEEVDKSFSPVRHFIAGEGKTVLDATQEKLLRGEPADMELQVHMGDKGLVWLKSYIYPVWDAVENRTVRAYGVALDVTKEKEAADALRKSEQRSRAMLGQSFQMIALFDEQGRLIEANKTALQFAQLKPEQVVGRHISVIYAALGGRELQRKVERQVEMVLAGEIVREELAVTTPSGNRHILDTSLKAVQDEDGRATLLLWEAGDVTDEKQATAAMVQAQKAESLGVLAGGIAHDFNNLLTGILAQASLTQYKIGRESPAAKNIEKVIFASKQAAALTRQMLAYAGKGDFTLESLNINTIVLDNINLFRASISKNIDVQADLTEDIALIRGDMGQTQQIIMNLLINAAEAVDEHAGHIMVRTEVAHYTAAELVTWIGHDSLADGLYVCLAIEDNGCGLSPEVQSKIFDPFFSTKSDGRGLGLAALLGAVNAQSGGVNVTSQLSVGTTFQVVFPADRTPTAATVMPVENDEVWQSTAHYTILFVDDEADIREMAQECFETMKWSCHFAENGRETINRFQQFSEEIDLVVLDQQMPVLGGLASAQMLRQIQPDIPIIFSSGYTPDKIDLDDDNNSFLAKPYTAEQLIQQISQQLTKETVHAK